jgi:hypothetical protein
MMKAWTVVEEMGMLFDELVNDPAIEAAEAEAAMEDEILRQNREWLADPANRDSEIYSDIYKDVYGVRPRW